MHACACASVNVQEYVLSRISFLMYGIGACKVWWRVFMQINFLASTQEQRSLRPRSALPPASAPSLERTSACPLETHPEAPIHASHLASDPARPLWSAGLPFALPFALGRGAVSAFVGTQSSPSIDAGLARSLAAREHPCSHRLTRTCSPTTCQTSFSTSTPCASALLPAAFNLGSTPRTKTRCPSSLTTKQCTPSRALCTRTPRPCSSFRRGTRRTSARTWNVQHAEALGRRQKSTLHTAHMHSTYTHSAALQFARACPRGGAV